MITGEESDRRKKDLNGQVLDEGLAVEAEARA